MYTDRACWRRRRKLAASGLGERDRWAITVDAQRLHAHSWAEQAIEAYLTRAIAFYRRLRKLDLSAQKQVEAIEWNLSCLPADEFIARMEASLAIHELTDRQLVRLWKHFARF